MIQPETNFTCTMPSLFFNYHIPVEQSSSSCFASIFWASVIAMSKRSYVSHVSEGNQSEG